MLILLIIIINENSECLKQLQDVGKNTGRTKFLCQQFGT